MSKEQNFCYDKSAISTRKTLSPLGRSFIQQTAVVLATFSDQTRHRSFQRTRPYKAINLNFSIHVERKKYGRF